MGIFRAISAAVRDTAEVQWRELFLCDAMPDSVLITRGFKRVSNRSANTNQSDDTITHGSIIAVADGQAAIVVSGGKVIACCTEPGEFVYHDPDHGPALKSFFKETARRISFGGSAPSSHGVQRVYYVNMKESLCNPFSGALPTNYDLTGRGSLSGRVFCSGMFSYRIIDPVRFYKLVTGNVKGAYTREDLSARIAAEILRSLGRAAGSAAQKGVRPVELAERSEAVCEDARRDLCDKWMEDHGLELLSLAVDSLRIPEKEMLQNTEFAAALAGDPIRESTVGAKKAAESSVLKPEQTVHSDQVTEQVLKSKGNDGSWICSCGTRAQSKFCPNCGRPRPTASEEEAAARA